MSRPVIYDGFCGAGGAAMGYYRAGFDVVGCDIRPQPNYPFDFILGDALEVFASLMGRVAAAHFSPPCQHWSDLAKRNGNAEDHPQLIEPTRKLAVSSGLPYVIENVEGSPLIDPLVLCGTQFPELSVIRHRLFESSVALPALPHGRHPLVFTMDKRKNHYGKLDQDVSYVQVTGGGNATVANKARAMGIDWMTGAQLNEAIPPAFTQYVGGHLLEHLSERAA